MNRIVLLSTLAFGLILFGLGMTNSGFLVLALPLAVFVLTGLLFGSPYPRVTAERYLSARRVGVGLPVTVRITLTNQGDKLEQVWSSDTLPADLEKLSGQTNCLVSLEPGESTSFEYTVRARRGTYFFPALHATTSDYLGLVRRNIPLGRKWFNRGAARYPAHSNHPDPPTAHARFSRYHPGARWRARIDIFRCARVPGG